MTNFCAASVITTRTPSAALAQAADQVEGFVSGDAAADDEQDAAGRGFGRALSCWAIGRLCGGDGAGNRGASRLGRGAPQNGAHLVLDRTAIAGGAQAQRCFRASSSWRTVRLAMGECSDGIAISAITFSGDYILDVPNPVLVTRYPA